MPWVSSGWRCKIQGLGFPKRIRIKYSEISHSSTGTNCRAEVRSIHFNRGALANLSHLLSLRRLGAGPVAIEEGHSHAPGAYNTVKCLIQKQVTLFLLSQYRAIWGSSPAAKAWAPLSSSSFLSTVPPLRESAPLPQ